MKCLILIAVAAITFSACNNNTPPTTENIVKPDSNTVATTPVAKDTSITGCFVQIFKKDTATMQLDAKGITITGPLSYNYFEKDRNGGTVQAEMDGNILTGWYLFRSEGVMSVRQVAWKVGKGELWPAYGDMKERNDSSVFVNVDQLKYDSTRPFRKVSCTL